MTDSVTHRPATDAPPPIEADSTYQLTLGGLILPVWLHYAFNAAAAVCILLLGHPLLAAASFVACSLTDTVYQRTIRAWLAASGEIDPDRGLAQLSVACALRVSIYLAAPLAMALRGGVIELAYLGVVATTLIVLAPSAGSLSQRIFWALAAPVLLATSVAAALTLPPMAAGGLCLALASLTCVLALISTGTTKAITTWYGAFNANLAMMQELKDARDQALAERVAADEAREEARRANSSKSSFLATMSHEIRTPMNGVLGMAQLLQRDETNPVQATRLATLLESGEYLMSILDDILDVSKIDAGRLEIVRGVEDLRLFLDRVVGFWGARAGEKGVALSLHVDEDVPDFVMMDGLRLRQVLFNLVGNALKFTDTGAVEVIGTARPRPEGGVWVHMAVRDTGPGIAAAHLPDLFERFSQADEDAVRRYGGTGLGLAIAKQLTELMGGRIWAESEFGEGATFHVEIPLELANAGAAAVSVGGREEEHSTLPSLQILAVDDNPVNLLVLDQMLTALGHAVVKAGSGAEALESLSAQPFDLVLMDIQMPDMTGDEVLQRLRAEDGPNQTAPVIALTADVTTGGRQHYLELGFTGHSSKPIQIQDLMEAIARAISGASAHPAKAA